MRGLLKRKVLLSNTGLVLILLLGATYLMVDIMRINPLHDHYDVTVNMDRSGGLLQNNDVTYRGLRVGKVTAIKITEMGVAATAQIDSRSKIPMGVQVAVQALSAAGEQYIDFRPTTDQGPFLENGSVIDAKDVKTPTPISNLVDDMSALLDQIDPNKVNNILTELYKALGGGPDSLRSIVDSGTVLLASMDQVLPQTTALIDNLRTVVGTTTQIQPDLGTLTNNAGILFDQTTAADKELRTLLDVGPGQLASIGGVIADTTDPITNVITNFVAITKAAKLRSSALSVLFPSLRDGGAALGIPAHDGEFHTMLDIFPRPTCQYDTIPVSPAKIGSDQVRKYNYCVTKNPALQIRGAANAPRPPGPDNTSGPPPGVTGNEMTNIVPPR
ncbi:MlaD family protein [Antrihabitans cavernicola]|uniref:MCE family protein n=1 Tax=Antrihabitans cavernicola TaxID=2495913 RepID=A0A5A7S7T5_9NOCA|nr:MlaD family protein [Spelaeibacter cavernicola]KAA0019440.1 MCE family protein [Spelaeibacter cavernicola]